MKTKCDVRGCKESSFEYPMHEINCATFGLTFAFCSAHIEDAEDVISEQAMHAMREIARRRRILLKCIRYDLKANPLPPEPNPSSASE